MLNPSPNPTHPAVPTINVVFVDSMHTKAHRCLVYSPQ